MRHLRHLTAVLALLVGALVLSSCGSDDQAPAASSGTKTIDITFQGDTVKPNGERVEVGIGQAVQFEVTADAAGEIHVHSDPEQHVNYHAGTTQATLGSFDIPGQITIESHSLDKVIVVLQVS
jgi:hypothetical protein